MKYRQKNRILLSTYIVVLLLAYKFSFLKTYEVAHSYLEVKKQISEAELLPKMTQSLNVKKRMLNFELQAGVYLKEEDQSKILKVISNYALSHAIVIAEIQPTKKISGELFSTINTTVLANGSFVALLGLINYLEFDTRIGKINQVEFANVENRATGEKQLQLRILVQNIIENEKE